MTIYICGVNSDSEVIMMKLVYLLIVFGLSQFGKCERNVGSRSFNQSESEIVFYDLKTKEQLAPPITTLIEETGNHNLSTINLTHIRLPFIGQPCGCGKLFKNLKQDA